MLLVSSDFGTGNSISVSLIVLSLVWIANGKHKLDIWIPHLYSDCKRETQAGYMDSSSVFGLQTGNTSWIYGFLICIRGSRATSPKLVINSDPYFRTGNYFNSGESSARLTQTSIKFGLKIMLSFFIQAHRGCGPM
jgi:hypothetical protein